MDLMDSEMFCGVSRFVSN